MFVFQTCILSLPILAKGPNGGITRWCDPSALEGGPSDAVVIAKALMFPTFHLREHFGGKDPIDRMLTGSVSSSANEGPKTKAANISIEVTAANPGGVIKPKHRVRDGRIPTAGSLVHIKQTKRNTRGVNFNLNHLTRIIRSFSKDNYGKRFSDSNCEATVVATEGLNENDIPSKLPGYPHLSSEVLLRDQYAVPYL